MTQLAKTRTALLKAQAQATTALAEARAPHEGPLTVAHAEVERAAAAHVEAQRAQRQFQQQLDELLATQKKVTADLTGAITQARQWLDGAAHTVGGTGPALEAARAALVDAQKPIRVWLDLCASLAEALERLDDEERAVASTIFGYESADRARAEEAEAARHRCRTCGGDPSYGYCRDCDITR